LEPTSIEETDYMATNGTAPNVKKTEFMVFQKEKSRKLKVGNLEVQEAEEFWLLGGILHRDMNRARGFCRFVRL
jgi:hypothetical protein